MSTVTYDSIVSKTEVEALKDMIFKRAKERAQAMAQGVQSNYSDSVQSDIMDIARDSFVKSNNPFSQIAKSETHPVRQETVQAEKEEKEERAEIGFPQRHVESIKVQINYKVKTANETVVNNVIESGMTDADNDFRKKQSFMGALDFLNSQASITLASKKGGRFEALA